MAKHSAVDGLTPCPADEIFARITAWHQSDNPNPDELIEWLTRASETFTAAVCGINQHREQIADSGDGDLQLKATSIVINGLDFLERADVAASLLSGLTEGRVNQAFLEGVRIGLLYERLMSLVDGRYSARWSQEGGRRHGAEVTNAAHKELHATYQAEVNVLVAAGDSYTAATEKVAARHCVNARTVRNNTVNESPRNRGGRRKSE